MGCASSKEPLGQEDLEYMLEKTNYDEHTIQGSFICNVKRIYSELIQLVIRALVDYSELSLVRMDYVTQKSRISPCMTFFILLFDFVYVALDRKCEQMLIFYSKQPNYNSFAIFFLIHQKKTFSCGIHCILVFKLKK